MIAILQFIITKRMMEKQQKTKWETYILYANTFTIHIYYKIWSNFFY